MTVNWQDVIESPSLASASSSPLPEHLRAARDTVDAFHLIDYLMAKQCHSENIVAFIRANYPAHVDLAIYKVYWSQGH